MWHCSPGVATVQKEADLQRRWPLTSKAAERVLGGPSTTQSITSQSLLVSRTVRGHRSLDEWTHPQTFLCRKLLFFWSRVGGLRNKSWAGQDLPVKKLLNPILFAQIKLQSRNLVTIIYNIVRPQRAGRRGWTSSSSWILVWFYLLRDQKVPAVYIKHLTIIQKMLPLIKKVKSEENVR